MTEAETPQILDGIEALVTDQLQVVSYKWLSRKFLVSSNVAKRLLQEFVEKRGNGLEIVYTLSGWLKSSPSTYHIRLVSDPRLKEAKQDFAGNCSVQVYSVQGSIPKDPVALWNAEFVQAEELYSEPSAIDNCLRDNRFCGISNSSVKRNVDGNLVSVSVPQARTVGLPGTSKAGILSSTQLKEVKIEHNGQANHDKSIKPPLGKERGLAAPADQKKVENDKSNSGAGGSLANLWGRAAANSKTSCAAGDAQRSSHEAFAGDGGAHNEVKDVDIKRASNCDGKRRRVIFDYSDEEENEDVVSLASPNMPKDKLNLNTKQGSEDSILEAQELKFEKRECVPSVSSPENLQGHGPEVDASLNNKEINASSSPKRRRVIKTRIDERGREVTEVVWEDGVTGTEKIAGDAKQKEDSSTAKKSESQTSDSNRSTAPRKSAVVGATASTNAGGKGGSKKGGNAKGPKQGNIMSFFKKV